MRCRPESLTAAFGCTLLLLTLAAGCVAGDESKPAVPPSVPVDTEVATPADPTPSLPMPTPHPSNTPWVSQRMDAVIRLYNISGPGESLLRSLDLRQMRGEPGFFGSYGFHSWTGVGEAKPIGVMHELGHAYWGGFPVDGRPELSWEVPADGELSPAMSQYHADILTFMAQPPDGYEVLRQRLRNLPNLSQDNPDPLFHTLEADLVYNTGGGLALTPPILRKYWNRFMTDGQWESWPLAVAWFQSLDDEERAQAGKWTGFEHLDLRQRRSTQVLSGKPGIGQDIREWIGGEERQRLFDLADQFDLLLGDSQEKENFQFWRGYLRDKLRLHPIHPAYLPSLGSPAAGEFAAAMDFIESLDGLTAREKAERLETRLGEQPFLVNFLPALDNDMLLDLFANQPQLPEGATLQATASFVERLQEFGREVDQILAAADPESGGRELADLLQRTGLEQEQDIKLLMELLRDADRQLASNVVQTLPPDTIAGLIQAAPFHLRTILTPPQLMTKLNIDPAASTSEMFETISLFLENPSGNFGVDEPFLSELHRVIAGLAATRPDAALEIIQETLYPLEGFILEQPRAAVTILNSDIEVASRLVRDSDPVISPPARVIYRLIATHPEFAARMTVALDESSPEPSAAGSEVLAYFAYDDARSRWWPDLGISLARDGEYLQALWQLKGPEWLGERLAIGVVSYRERAARGEVSADFFLQYRSTWEAAVSTLPPGPAREDLSRMFDRAVQNQGSAP